MTHDGVGIVALCLLLLLVLMRAPVGIVLCLLGLAGNAYFLGFQPTLTQLQLVIWELTHNFVLVALPLFVLMGQLAHQFELGKDLYQCFNKWFGAIPGGLAATSIVSSASFGAVSGSSLATVAAVGKSLLPELNRYHYDKGFSAGSLASAGVLAILIPPSIPLVFFSAWTETSLGDLFLAGVVPGLMLGGCFLIYVLVRSRIQPQLAPVTEPHHWREKVASLRGLLPVGALLVVVLGSIYLGLATPTEAAAVGVAGVILIALAKRRLSLARLQQSIEQSILLTSNILLLLLGGILFSRFLAQTNLTPQLVQTIVSLEQPVELLLILLALMYLLLGAVLDTFSMIILTLPFVFPLLSDLGVDPVWLGIFIVMMIEIALITPPIGLNVFIMQRLDPSIPINKIYQGTFPFVIIAMLMVIVLISFPGIALWLPQWVNSLI